MMKHPTSMAEVQNDAVHCTISGIAGKRRRVRNPNSPLEAIRSRCYDCAGYEWREVRECVVTDCALYPFRHGRRPGTVTRRRGDDA